MANRGATMIPDAVITNRIKTMLPDMVMASRGMTAAGARLFSTSTRTRREQQGPWDTLDSAFEQNHSNNNNNNNNHKGSGAGLSADEQMWLDAMNVKLDRQERMRSNSNSSNSNNSNQQPRWQPTDATADNDGPWAQLDQSLEQSSKPVAVQAAKQSGAPALAQAVEQRSQPAVVQQAGPTLTHVNPDTHQASMVDISHKAATMRSATAVGYVYVPRDVLHLLRDTSGDIQSPAGKGPVFATARLSGILAAKKTSDLIPLCHHVPLSHISVDFELVDPLDLSSAESHDEECTPYISISSTAKTTSGTGVEMEALSAVQVAALTVWDMLKAVAGKEMTIGNVKVVSKSGGKSGDWERL
ncbi:unnamed protein product [Sympodiomycopsis kandeliae]